MVMPYNTSENYYNFYTLILLLQVVLSEFSSDSHSVIKPMRVPVNRDLHWPISPTNLKFLRHFDFKYILATAQTGGQTDGMQQVHVYGKPN